MSPSKRYSAQKAALTRAIKTKDREKVLAVCREAVRVWNEDFGYWPDDWSRWQRALNDVFPVFEAPLLESL